MCHQHSKTSRNVQEIYHFYGMHGHSSAVSVFWHVEVRHSNSSSCIMLPLRPYHKISPVYSICKTNIRRDYRPHIFWKLRKKTSLLSWTSSFLAPDHQFILYLSFNYKSLSFIIRSVFLLGKFMSNDYWAPLLPKRLSYYQVLNCVIVLF